ncbi:hypothetical protein EPA86_08795 [Litorilituus lipolyticus]|uniref:Uncharacterized protein n=1 Tax=Litorilituus lipolyticus TaxID=2491017 RepID=A0A502KVI3_9GAMM|nr:hypothetical protein EPA86_08795 [Litorilituus lipolyticus]
MSKLFILSLFFVHLGVNAESRDIKIQRAMAAAPAAISQNATIVDSDGSLLQKGTNGWTCMPDTMPGDKAPMCNDAVWMKMMKAVATKAEFTATGIGISYMLKGDIGSGVSNSTPYHPDHKNAHDYTETGPHMMIIVPKSMLEGVSRDPKSGGPYVMWGDTPYAHIMVPVE